MSIKFKIDFRSVDREGEIRREYYAEGLRRAYKCENE